MSRPYRLVISLINDSERRDRVKRFVVPEGLDVTLSTLAPIGAWVLAAIDGYDNDPNSDEETDLS